MIIKIMIMIIFNGDLKHDHKDIQMMAALTSFLDSLAVWKYAPMVVLRKRICYNILLFQICSFTLFSAIRSSG